MIYIDQNKCAWCGWCVHFCPRGALSGLWRLEVDPEKCTDCFDGMHHFDDNLPVVNRQQLLDPSRRSWRRLCVENCPCEAVVVQ